MKAAVPQPPTPSDIADYLRSKYDALWRGSIGKLRRGHIEIDPVLAARSPDHRRGLTLVARPSPEVRECVTRFLARLRRIEPHQYYYAPSEFHVTVLSLFTGTTEHARFFRRLPDYIAATDAALRNAPVLEFNFRGVTLSPAAILIQGFFADNALTDLRDALRQELRQRRLTEGLDVRYRVEAAHMTAVRFRTPLKNAAKLAAALEASREKDFGTAKIRSLHLVKNDWYMSHHVLEPLKRYRLLATKA